MKRDDVLSRLQQHEADLRKLGVEQLYLFESTARGEGAGRMIRKMNPHWGTTLDEFLAEDGTREAARTEALTRVAAWSKTPSRAKSRLRGEIVEAMRGLHKVGAVSDDELQKTTLRMLGKDPVR
jgi:hypothetical protein